MSFLEDTQVLQVLRGFNPWWQTGVVSTECARSFRRSAFVRAFTWLNNDSIRRTVLLTGARRVGKTTILYQLAQETIQTSLQAHQVLYISFDHPMLKMLPMNRIMEIYRANILGGSESALLLLDEINHAEDWSTWLKYLTDYSPQYKVVATGSVAATVGSGEGDTGTGRRVEIVVPTLSFYEYLGVRGQGPLPLPGGISLSTLPSLPREQQQQALALFSALEPFFSRYLLVGGFPETATLNDTQLAQQLLREDCLDRVLKRDMATLFGVRNVLDLEKVFVYLSLNSGQLIGQDSVARELNISRITLNSHLQSLERAYLTLTSPPLDHKGNRIPKSRAKVYVADAALRNAVLLKWEDALTDASYLESLVEAAVLSHLAGHFERLRPTLGHWKSIRTSRELSTVAFVPGRALVAAQVKYRDRPDILGSDPLLEFLELRPECQGFFVTKSSRDYGPFANSSRMFRIPAFMFLYLLG
ncbi:MAG: AAA family ATPase [Bacillota bacterium]|nr:MAG: AAA family ATPase [Bacillota bacterium]